MYNDLMKTAFVTGGNRGLGRGFVEQFLDKGFQVFAGVLDPEKVDSELKSRANLFIIKLDVSDDESIKSATAEVSKHTNHLDYLVNNAGLNKDTATNGRKELASDLKDLDREVLRKMFDVNSLGPIMVLKGFVGLMKEDPSFAINISSCRASHHDEAENDSGNYGYRGSKAALTMLTLCSLYDLPKNVRTFSVHPGNVHTDMNPGGEQEPYDQAGKIIGITENWKDEFNGRFLKYDGTFYPL